MKQNLALALILLSLAGCGAVYDTPSIAGVHRNPAGQTAPESVQIIEGEPGRRYVSLGEVSTTVRQLNVTSPVPTREHVAERLRVAGGWVGAHALMNVRYGEPGVDGLGVAGIVLGGIPGALSAQSMAGRAQAIMFVD